MKLQDVFVYEDAIDDLNEGKAFYDKSEEGVGNYFFDSLIADIESLILYGGIHSKEFGMYRMFAKRFPYAIYYEIQGKNAFIVAVLPVRRNPAWIIDRISNRK
jgi:hypothetical protein